MKKFLVGSLLIVGILAGTLGNALALDKGDFALGIDYKNIQFDTAGDTEADMVGAVVGYHGKLMGFSGVDVNFTGKMGTYFGKVDDDQGLDDNIDDFTFSLGVGLSKALNNFTVGADVLGVYDHISINSTNFDPVGIGVDGYITYSFDEHTIGIRGGYTKFLTEDELDYGTTIGLTYGFKF